LTTYALAQGAFLCPQCGTQLAPEVAACPQCGRLVHAERLTQLAAFAKDAADRGDISGALSAWREAIVLLPPNSKQHAAVLAKIGELDKLVPGSPIPGIASPSNGSASGKSAGSRAAAGLGAIGLMLWKLKALFFGLGKLSTLASMLLSLGVYWSLWGWQFALGIVLSIYVHEMGHVIALRRYGFKATAPMFIPGLGAVIRLQQRVDHPEEDAEIGLAGPMYGLGAAIVCAAIWLATKQPIFAAIAGVGAWINLFNLMPFGTLDGGRGFHAMSQLQKFICAAIVAGAFAISHDGILLLVGILCIGRAFSDRKIDGYRGSWKATVTYCGLIAALTAISLLRLHESMPQ